MRQLWVNERLFHSWPRSEGHLAEGVGLKVPDGPETVSDDSIVGFEEWLVRHCSGLRGRVYTSHRRMIPILTC
jgi:hypothetical protein